MKNQAVLCNDFVSNKKVGILFEQELKQIILNRDNVLLLETTQNLYVIIVRTFIDIQNYIYKNLVQSLFQKPLSKRLKKLYRLLQIDASNSYRLLLGHFDL